MSFHYPLSRTRSQNATLSPARRVVLHEKRYSPSMYFVTNEYVEQRLVGIYESSVWK